MKLTPRALEIDHRELTNRVSRVLHTVILLAQSLDHFLVMSGELRNRMEQGQLLGLRLMRSGHSHRRRADDQGRMRVTHDEAVCLANTAR